MPRTRPINICIQELEYQLAKYQAVLKEFPDAKWHWKTGFQSKLVNQKYAGFTFSKRGRGLYVLPYCEISFTYNGNTELITVWSKPKYNRLIRLTWDVNLRNYVMKFAKLTVNLKNNKFKDDMLNSCRSEIMSFIKNNPGYSMDDKNLEPRLKKLLIFT
jgi:hypothetical protein